MNGRRKTKQQPTGSEWGWVDSKDQDGNLSTGARPAAIRRAQERKLRKQLNRRAQAASPAAVEIEE